MLAAIMTLGVLLSGLASFDEMRKPVIAIAAVLVLVILMLTFLFSTRFRRLFHLQKIYSRLPIAHHISAAGDAVRLYRSRIGVLIKAIGMTIGAHVFFVGSIALMGTSLSLEIPWYNYFIYVPLIYIAGAVPITPGGIGLIEGLFVAFLVGSSGGASKVLALALLARIIPMFWSLPGAIVAVTGPKLPKTEVLEAELGISDEVEEK